MTSSRLGRNSLRRTTPSAFLPLRSIDRRSSQFGSKGSTSVMYWSRRSCDTPNEHSVKKVALPFCERVRTKLRDPVRLPVRERLGEDAMDEV